MDKDRLLEDIKKEFFYEKKFKYEDVANIRSEYSISAYEGNQVAKYFEGKSNADIELVKLLEEYPGDHTACIVFMKPEAASYFIGAYLYMGVSDEIYGQDIRFHLMNLFDSSILVSDGLKNWFNQLVGLFADSQKAVVIEFITYLEKNYKDDLLVVDFEKAKRNFLSNDVGEK